MEKDIVWGLLSRDDWIKLIPVVKVILDYEQKVDAMLEVAKEFGLDITFMALKQFGLRQQGIP